MGDSSASKKLMYVFLIVSFNALVSKIIFLVRFNSAHDSCIKTYNIDPETEGGDDHPNYRLMWCNGVKTASMTGKCPDGTVGDLVEELMLIKSGTRCEDGEKSGDFNFGVCCTVWQCKQSVYFGSDPDVVWIGYEDDVLENYPQLDCIGNERCYAWCSDGVWTNNKAHGNLRRVLYVATFVFAIIDIVVEGICTLIAFAYSVFGESCIADPVTTSPMSFIVLLALNAIGSNELVYTLKGRFVLMIHIIDELVTVGLVMPLIITLAGKGIDLWENQSGLMYLFISSCAEILFFFKKIRVANAELKGPPS